MWHPVFQNFSIKIVSKYTAKSALYAKHFHVTSVIMSIPVLIVFRNITSSVLYAYRSVDNVRSSEWNPDPS